MGLKALTEAISSDQKKTTTVKLNTFHTQNKKLKKAGTKAVPPGKSDEVTALLRMTQITASREDVNIVDYIGQHECSKFPPSLFQDDGSMRVGTKASIVKAVIEETGVSTSSELPQVDRKTAVVVDAMYAIRRWSLKKGETFSTISERYQYNLLTDIPAGTKIIHFCCDRYSGPSLQIS